MVRFTPAIAQAIQHYTVQGSILPFSLYICNTRHPETVKTKHLAETVFFTLSVFYIFYLRLPLVLIQRGGSCTCAYYMK